MLPSGRLFFSFFNEDEKFIIWINHMKEKTFSLLCWQHYLVRKNSVLGVLHRVLYWCDDIHITPELYIQWQLDTYEDCGELWFRSTSPELIEERQRERERERERERDRIKIKCLNPDCSLNWSQGCTPY